MPKSKQRLFPRVWALSAKCWIPSSVAEAKIFSAFLGSGWGMDRLYDILFVNPFKMLAAKNKNDAVDDVYKGVSLLSRGLCTVFSAGVKTASCDATLGC